MATAAVGDPEGGGQASLGTRVGRGLSGLAILLLGTDAGAKLLVPLRA
jgi:hypothetical protein